MKIQKDYSAIEKQLNSRKQSRFVSLKSELQKANNLFLFSPCDQGVVRNGGRRGSAHGPKAIMAQLNKMTIHTDKDFIWSSENVLPESELDFEKMQKQSQSKIRENIENFNGQNTFHFGGGHDHIYPLISSIREKHGPINIINIDAHLDTRVDKEFHSGTPFRQFLEENKDAGQLIQVGIQAEANAKENYENMDMQIITSKEAQSLFSSGQLTKRIENALENKNLPTVLSLDADALESTTMEAVSAVNGNGLSTGLVREIFHWYKSFSKNPVVGIYEYNPVYENLSCKGSKFLAQLCFLIMSSEHQ